MFLLRLSSYRGGDAAPDDEAPAPRPSFRLMWEEAQLQRLVPFLPGVLQHVFHRGVLRAQASALLSIYLDACSCACYSFCQHSAWLDRAHY